MTTPQPPRAFCCEPMRGYSTAKCQEHRDEPALCSDVLVVHSERHGPGLPIHVDGGGGMIVIDFCPWCGTRIGDGAGTATPADEDERTIDDEFGNEWSLCARPNCGLEIVRPGKVQCWCDSTDGPLAAPTGARTSAEAIGPSGERETGVDPDLTRLRTEIRAVLGGCPDGDGDLVQGVETLGRIRDSAAALLTRCGEVEANTLGRHGHGGYVLPALLSTSVIRALLAGGEQS